MKNRTLLQRVLVLLCFVALGSVCFGGEKAAEPPPRDDQRLGKDLAAFDIKTWRIVAKYWNRTEQCVDLVDAHIVEHRGRVLGVLADFGATACEVDADGWTIESEDPSRDVLFMASYLQRIKKTETTKKALSEDSAMADLAREVMKMEFQFRESICAEIAASNQKEPGCAEREAS